MGFDPKIFSPFEIERSCGSASKVRRNFGWKPQLRFAQVVLLVETQAPRAVFMPLLGSS